ncbi:MAG: D-hexose-6-phosphate mutarotase, partial [Endozoicomonas sp.]
PVCWPWFGAISSPSHGFARISEWQLYDVQDNEQEVIIKLSLNASEQSRAIWPHEFSTILLFTLSSTLKISLDVKNTDSVPWCWSGALHTYFNIAHTQTTKITGAGSTYIDSLMNDQIVETEEDLLIDKSIDRVYMAPEDTIQIYDQGNNRVISINNHGDNAAVIWNPWDDISKNMADMSDNGYITMVCVEATRFARDLESGSIIRQGESQMLSTEIRSILQK